MTANSLLIIAFDGLDHQLVQHYDCPTLTNMSETGKITTHSLNTLTSELFASLITGKHPDHHGITGLSRWNRPVIGRILTTILPGHRRQRIPGAQRLYDTIKTAAAAQKIKYDHTDLTAPALFDRIPDSRALFVPAYNPSPAWRTGILLNTCTDAPLQESEELWEREHLYRRHTLQNALTDNHQLLMAHFHKPDILQHLYAYGGTVHHSQKIQDLYQEMDTLAATIRDTAQDTYDLILFLSDHGLPTTDGHRPQAFYSCSTELFPEQTPHITDFHDAILTHIQGDTSA